MNVNNFLTGENENTLGMYVNNEHSLLELKKRGGGESVKKSWQV